MTQTTNWQPIETAPKDGTQIILYKSPTEKCDVPFWVIGKFVGREELFPYGECYDEENTRDEPNTFETFVLVTSWNHKDISSTGFTHWMELPDAP